MCMLDYQPCQHTTRECDSETETAWIVRVTASMTDSDTVTRSGPLMLSSLEICVIIIQI